MKLSPQDVESLKDTNDNGWNGFSYENTNVANEADYEMNQS
jgi:hypothetical protein